MEAYSYGCLSACLWGMHTGALNVFMAVHTCLAPKSFKCCLSLGPMFLVLFTAQRLTPPTSTEKAIRSANVQGPRDFGNRFRQRLRSACRRSLVAPPLEAFQCRIQMVVAGAVATKAPFEPFPFADVGFFATDFGPVTAMSTSPTTTLAQRKRSLA